MKFPTNSLTTAVRYALTVGAFVAAGAVFAQEAPASTDQATPEQAKSLQTVVVTGSRIRSIDLVTQQPVFTLDRAEIQKQGFVTVDDILQHISSISIGSTRATNNGNDGRATISLRDLGSARTLVLVNGHRWLQTLDGNVDLTTIPVAVIDHVDVLKDGASTLYGSDAIAGVVNIITRDRMDGAEANVYWGQFQQGDGTNKTADFTVGANTDRSSLIFSVGYLKGDAVSMGNRALTRDIYPGFPGVGNSSYGDHGSIFNLTTGKRLALNPGGDPRNIADYHPYVGAIDGYNYQPNNYLLTPTERQNMFVQSNYRLTDDISWKTTAAYNVRKSSQQLAPSPIGIGVGSPYNTNAPFSLDKDSYYNPTGEDVGVNRRFVEAPRRFSQDNQNVHMYTGLDGVFSLGERGFNWDVGFDYNHSSNLATTHGLVNMLALKSATGPSFMDTDGIVKCGTPGNIIDGCTPINMLGEKGAITADMLKYVGYVDKESSGNRSLDWTANLSGDIVELPAGMMQFATGWERRDENGYDTPDSFTASGNSSGNALAPTRGGYTLNEYYAEISAPLLKDMPGAQQLSIDVSARHTDYETGTTTNDKYGVMWKPIQDLLVRATFGHGFRAPSVNNLFGGLSDDYANFNDPCDMTSGKAASDASVKAACIAAGVPDGYEQIATGGYGGQTQIPFKAGSNPDAQPEKSLSRTLGLVWSPSFITGLDASLDWYHIRITNSISQPDATTVLNQCYVQGNPAFCDKITRSTSSLALGQVLRADETVANLGSTDVEGYDFNVNYRFPETSFGKFRAGIDSTYLVRYDTKVTPDQVILGNVGFADFFRFRANTVLDWSLGDFGATWNMRFQSSARFDCSAPDFNGPSDPGAHCNMPDYISPLNGVQPLARVGAFTYHDMQFRWSAPWNATFSVGVNNAFNKKPVSIYDSTRTFPEYYDISGRFYYVRYNQKF